MIYATVENADGEVFEARGVYRPGLRSTSYYDPDEPPTVEDVEVAREGSDEWSDPEDAGLDVEDVVEALLEARLR